MLLLVSYADDLFEIMRIFEIEFTFGCEMKMSCILINYLVGAGGGGGNVMIQLRIIIIQQIDQICEDFLLLSIVVWHF